MLHPHLKAGIHYGTCCALPYLKNDCGGPWLVEVRKKTSKCLKKDPEKVLKEDIFQKDMNNNEDYRRCMFPLSLNARGNQ